MGAGWKHGAPRGKGVGGKANGAGAGEGWGGPPKGASATRIVPGDPDGIQSMSNDPRILARGRIRLDHLRDKIYELALSAEREETQLAAANSYLNREEGTPVQRVVTASVTDPSQLTDEDLAAIAASGRRGALAAPEDTD
jgi:hypothetical protein